MPRIHRAQNPKALVGRNQRFANSHSIESTHIIPVSTCNCCGKDLSDTEPSAHERRTRIDIVFEKTVDHFDAEIKTCPGCQGSTKGEFDKDLLGPMQYGLGVKTYVLNLLVTQMVSLNRAGKLMHSMIGQLISEAAFLRWIMELYFHLQIWEEQTIEALLSSPVMHVDETSMKAGGKDSGYMCVVQAIWCSNACMSTGGGGDEHQYEPVSVMSSRTKRPGMIVWTL